VPLPRRAHHRTAASILLHGSVWLALLSVAVKACYLGLPGLASRAGGQSYLTALAAVSYADVAFVAAGWSLARLLMAAAGPWPTAARALAALVVALAAISSLYVVASVIMFGSFGGFMTYQLLALVGDVRMLRSSLAAYLTAPVVAALVSVPAVYLLAVCLSLGASRKAAAALAAIEPGRRWVRLCARPAPIAGLAAAAWIAVGANGYATRWATRQDRAVAASPQWVLLTSWWRAAHGGALRLGDGFDEADLADFQPIGDRLRGAAAPIVRRVALRLPARRPLNVILIVLESVAARWTSLYGPYLTTPTLAAESAYGLVFDNFYAHIGRSSNSLAAILLSAYPKLDFRDITDEYPRLGGTSLARVFRDRGYRTAFVTPSDLSWAGWTTFLDGRGFDSVGDYRRLGCSELLTSWGVEDRCLFDGMIRFIEADPQHPFFLMAWTQQTHHPYEPTPGVPLLDLVREHGPDDYELNRYLNVLHETDRQIARLFDAVRRSGLGQDTLIVIVGDHGQAFGYPHEGNYAQGRMVYEEDVHVPLLVWDPRLRGAGARPQTIGSHVDLAPTIAALAGLLPAPDWQGRSLLDADRPPRAYFYVAEDRFRLGVREGRWKYIYDLREAVDELYDLERDPLEQRNLAAVEPRVALRLRQRLAAWAEANRRQYDAVPRLEN